MNSYPDRECRHPGAAALPLGAAYDQESVSKLAPTPLDQAPLPGVEGKEISAVRLAVPPGYVGERHTRPVPVFLYIIEGEVLIETDQGTQTGSAGDFLAEPIDAAMQPRNASSSEPAEVLVLQVGNIGEPTVLPAE